MSLAARGIGFCGLYALGWCLHFLWNAPSGSGAVMVLLIPAKIGIAIVAFSFVVRWCFTQERQFLHQAMDELSRETVNHPDIARLCADPVMREVVAASRRGRRKIKKQIRVHDGQQAVADAKKTRIVVLEALQAWGRRGSGVDELAHQTTQPGGFATAADTGFTPQLTVDTASGGAHHAAGFTVADADHSPWPHAAGWPAQPPRRSLTDSELPPWRRVDSPRRPPVTSPPPPGPQFYQPPAGVVGPPPAPPRAPKQSTARPPSPGVDTAPPHPPVFPGPPEA